MGTVFLWCNGLYTVFLWALFGRVSGCKNLKVSYHTVTHYVDNWKTVRLSSLSVFLPWFDFGLD